ncbi:Ger(x)C family spore germination protein [Halobacillus litoralis]|uniref:Ger(x)C family spore germination protein n=1 Tax=Halobacillus litoralis TaxID=45668 RepID=UPI001CFC6D21|nr:Ger(x)C family spore germination protein [Halobacillus litoralis]WLR47296.1 Ger(x)C family spore germination protein [Halobacillus litoralis]
MKKIMLIVFLWIPVLLLTGCGDVKEIQDLNYATAIGIDYKDKKYVTYVQMISLNTLANTEGSGSSSPEVMVSETSASTFSDALFEVYDTSQDRIIWSHVSSIILSESAIQQGFTNVFDAMIRYYEFRLTPWVFGTKEPMHDLLSTPGFFNQGAMETLLHNPENVHQQNFLMSPLELYMFAREFYEPNMTTVLPVLKIDDNEWMKNKQPEPKIAYDGGFFLEDTVYKGFFELDKLKGLRWITPNLKRTAVHIEEKNKDTKMLVVIEDSKYKIKVNNSESKPTFKIYLTLKGYVVNQNEQLTVGTEEVTKLTEEYIKEDIQQLFNLSQETNTDLFNFSHLLYSRKHQYWKSISNKDEFFKSDGTISKINVEFNLKHDGAGKNAHY